jgi:hypothetical protein
MERVEDALRIVQIYAGRGPLEWSFRVEQGEWGIEHIRVRDWEAHLKFLPFEYLFSKFGVTHEGKALSGMNFNRLH